MNSRNQKVLSWSELRSIRVRQYFVYFRTELDKVLFCKYLGKVQNALFRYIDVHADLGKIAD